MAKQNGTLPKIDEDFMRELISQGVPAKQDKQPEDIPNPGGETGIPQEGQQTETVRMEKPTPRRRKGCTGTTGKPTSRKWNWQTDNPCT